MVQPMEGTRSFREVFAHVAAEGNTETAMDRAMQSLSAVLGGLSRATINTPDQVLRTEHPAPLVAYARMNTIVPPWTRKG